MSSFYEIRIKHLRAERDRLRLALAAPGTIVERIGLAPSDMTGRVIAIHLADRLLGVEPARDWPEIDGRRATHAEYQELLTAHLTKRLSGWERAHTRTKVDAELRREYDARGNAIGHAEQT